MLRVDHRPPMRLAPVQGVVLQGKGSEQLLLNTNNGSRCILNDFGRRIWSLLASRPTFPALVSRLAGAYTHNSELARDTGRLVVAWQDAGLVTWTNR
jgi:coenzyme PQQ synthesis protein D (PqqD)